jgi:hypothetical protein
LLPLDNRDRLLGAVEEEVAALEGLCGRLESALMHRRWEELSDAIADSRRVTHALQNALDESRSVRSAEFDESVFRRIRYVFAIRQNQMVRLQQFNDAVGERLSLLARWKSAVRSMGPRRAPASRLASLDQLT